MARSSPYASISRCNRVVLDTWRKDLAGKVPFSRRETRNHAWHEDAARAFGLQSGQKIGSPNGDPINEFFGSAQRLPDALQPLHQAEELAVSRLKESHQANELALSHLGGVTQVGAPKVRVVDALSRLEELHQANKLTVSCLEELNQANELALSYLDHSTRQSFRGYVVGLGGNGFTVDLHTALVNYATGITSRLGKPGIGNELR